MISEESTIFRTPYSPVSVVLKVVNFYEEYFVKNLSIRPLPNANVFLFSEEIERSNLFTDLQSSSLVYQFVDWHLYNATITVLLLLQNFLTSCFHHKNSQTVIGLNNGLTRTEQIYERNMTNLGPISSVF